MGDAYGPNKSPNMPMQCWRKGYQYFAHGGGASMICQTNDTEVHKPARKDLCERQEELTLKKTLHSGGGLAECSNEEVIMLLAFVFSKESLH